MGLLSVAAKVVSKYGAKAISKTGKAFSKGGVVRNIFSKIDTLGEFTLNGHHAVSDALKSTKGAKVLDKAKAAYQAVEAQKAAAKAGSTNVASKIINSNFLTRNTWAAMKNGGSVLKELVKLNPKNAWKTLNGNLLLQTYFLYGFGVPAVKDAYKEEGFFGAARESATQFFKLAGGTLGMTGLGLVPKIGTIASFFGWGLGEKAAEKFVDLFADKSNSEKKEYLIKEYGQSEEEIEQYISQGYSLEEIAGLLEQNRQFENRLLTGKLTDDDIVLIKSKGYSDDDVEMIKSYCLTNKDIKSVGCRPEELRVMLSGLNITPQDIKNAKADGKSLNDLVNERTKELKDSHGITDSDINEVKVNSALKLLTDTLNVMNLDFEKYDTREDVTIVLTLANTLDDCGLSKADVEQGKRDGKSVSTLIEEKTNDVKSKIAERIGLSDKSEERAAFAISMINASELGQQYAALSDAEKANSDNEIVQAYTDEVSQISSNPPSKDELVELIAQNSGLTVHQLYKQMSTPSSSSTSRSTAAEQETTPQGAVSQTTVSDTDEQSALDNQIYLELIKEYIKDHDGLDNLTDEDTLAECQLRGLTLANLYKSLPANVNLTSDDIYTQKIKELELMAERVVITDADIQAECEARNMTVKELYENLYDHIYQSNVA